MSETKIYLDIEVSEDRRWNYHCRWQRIVYVWLCCVEEINNICSDDSNPYRCLYNVFLEKVNKSEQSVAISRLYDWKCVLIFPTVPDTQILPNTNETSNTWTHLCISIHIKMNLCSSVHSSVYARSADLFIQLMCTLKKILFIRLRILFLKGTAGVPYGAREVVFFTILGHHVVVSASAKSYT